MLELIRHLPSAFAIGAVAYLVGHARALDPHSRSALRAALWPEFERGRRSTAITLTIFIAALSLASSSHWWLDAPLAVLLMQLAGGCVAAYVAVGSIVLMPHLQLICGRVTPRDEPGALALFYLLSWPLAYSRTLSSLIRSDTARVG